MSAAVVYECFGYALITGVDRVASGNGLDPQWAVSVGFVGAVLLLLDTFTPNVAILAGLIVLFGAILKGGNWLAALYTAMLPNAKG